MRRILRSLFRPVTRLRHRREVVLAERLWSRQQPAQAERFLAFARAAGKPRGLRWQHCEWTGTFRLGRERTSGLLTGFAGLVVRFEPIEGGEMEGVEAAGMPRDATAVFHFQNGEWGTTGRVLFNMTPDETLSRMSDQFDSVTAVAPPA